MLRLYIDRARADAEYPTPTVVACPPWLTEGQGAGTICVCAVLCLDSNPVVGQEPKLGCDSEAAPDACS